MPPIEHAFKWKNGQRTEKLTPLRALRARCMDCCNWSTHEVRNCQVTDCPAWVFRLGKNPGLIGKRKSPHLSKKAVQDAIQERTATE